MELMSAAAQTINGKIAFAKGLWQFIQETIRIQPQNIWELLYKTSFLGMLVVMVAENVMLVAYLGNVFMGEERREVRHRIFRWMMPTVFFCALFMLVCIGSLKKQGML